MRLSVHQAYDFDNYKDVIRIHRTKRRGVDSGHLARVTLENGKSTIAAIGGLDNDETDFIRLDLAMRKRLDVELGETHGFEVRRAYPWEALEWAAKATDPAARIATWIAIWSFFLGAIGILIELAK